MSHSRRKSAYGRQLLAVLDTPKGEFPLLVTFSHPLNQYSGESEDHDKNHEDACYKNEEKFTLQSVPYLEHLSPGLDNHQNKIPFIEIGISHENVPPLRVLLFDHVGFVAGRRNSHRVSYPAPCHRIST